MIEQVSYINQEKSKTEDYLISSIALLKKNVKDYNELVLFSSKLAREFTSLYDRLKEEPKDPNRRLPFKESQAAQYRQLCSAETKNVRRELRSFINVHEKDNSELAFPLVSSPIKVKKGETSPQR